MSNYDKILREKENNHPLEDSNKEKHWASLEKQLLTLPTKSNQPSKGLQKNLYNSILGLVAILIVGIFIFKYLTTKQPQIIEASVTQKPSVIKPPLPRLNVPYEIFTFDASVGDTLFTKNGSILIFPKDAVMDNSGNIITGNIEVQTREFNDPLDYYMSGIPMTYDSAGIKYTFVSSGMIDIKAYQKGALLKVNPNAKPQLNLVSTNSEENTNLYILDTTTGQWINKGKDQVTNFQRNINQEFSKTTKPVSKNVKTSIENFVVPLDMETEQIKKPLEPQKASGKNPTIKITIDPNSFKELLAYDNLKFEVLNSNSGTVGEDSKTEWDNVELLQNEGGKNYIAKFSSAAKTIKYEVKPVLEGKDYDAAINIYNEKIKAYYDQQKSRIANEKLQRDTLALREKLIAEENYKIASNNEAVNSNNELILAKNKQIEIENKRIEELNVLIIARNKKIEEEKKSYFLEMKEQQKIYDSLRPFWDLRNKSLVEEIKRQNKITDSLRQIWEQKNRAFAVNQNLLRSFTIDNFGYWNSDLPTLLNVNNSIPITATFVDEQNLALQISYINAIGFGVNRIFTFNNNNIRVLPKTNYIIISYYENEFYYLTFKEYQNLNISNNTRDITMRLKKYEGAANTIQDLRKVLYDN